MLKKIIIIVMIFYMQAILALEPHQETKKNLVETYALTYGGNALKLSGIAIGINGARGVIWPKKRFLCVNNKVVLSLAFYNNFALISRAQNSVHCLFATALFGTGKYLTSLAKR